MHAFATLPPWSQLAVFLCSRTGCALGTIPTPYVRSCCSLRVHGTCVLSIYIQYAPQDIATGRLLLVARNTRSELLFRAPRLTIGLHAVSLSVHRHVQDDTERIHGHSTSKRYIPPTRGQHGRVSALIAQLADYVPRSHISR